MKTITLRTLVREPLKVKRMTRTGQPVQVTDNGQPLWVIQPAFTSAKDGERIKATEEILDEVDRERPSQIKLSDIIRDSPR
jgi:hypothetical protein